MRDPAASSRPTVAGVGCPYELGPTQITATLGRVSARNAEVVEYREPWCATLSTSMGGPRAQMLPTAASLGPVQSPVKRKLLPSASRRSTTLSLLASPERPAGLSTSARAEPNLSLIHISEPTRQAEISYAVFCLKKKKKNETQQNTNKK